MNVKAATRSAARKSTSGPGLCGKRAAGGGQRSYKGFTLLELMVAIVMFSMISTAAYQLFMSVIRAQEVTQSVLAELDKLQRAEIVLEKDLFQMARRPIRDESGRPLAALKLPGTGGTLIEFTRSGWQNPLQTTRSTLQRVAYAVEGNELIRYYWPMLDRAPDTPRIRQSVMSGVNSVKFRFLDENKRWVSTWPPVQKLQPDAPADNLTQMPGAVEMAIDHEKMGPMITVVPLITYQPDQADKNGEQDGSGRSSRPGSPWQPSIEGFDGY
ncbi:type II secretion system minor pseudopilin GspJ [Endozoicomonas sp.]|uniref:type II secretion system minor pseudopilin GspJ n=1 Tax=Endozoicomonas sp. TaxID=1892382 RepID=UPI0028871F55|nr:type II secretion system minor pseudopilin GspJ [Endozoicomonas sp.]